MTDTTKTKPATKRARKAATQATEQPASQDAVQTEPTSQATTRAPTKASIVESLLRQQDGASLDALGEATGWLPHTCRAFLTGLRKKGRAIERNKREDGTTIYRLAESEVTD